MLLDASEGPLPTDPFLYWQRRESGLAPIVVINKPDAPTPAPRRS